AGGAHGAAAPTRVHRRDDLALRVGQQHGRAVGKAEHQRPGRRTGDQHIAEGPRLSVAIDQRDVATMHLVRGEQLVTLRADRRGSATQVLVHVLGAIADAVAHIERLTETDADATGASRDAVEDAWKLREPVEAEQVQAHAAAPASLAASTT